MKKKTIILIITVVIVFLILSMLIGIYVVPRILVVALNKPKEIKNSDLQKVELENTYLGDAYNVGVWGISMDLPYDAEINDKLYVYAPDYSLAEIRKYGYRVWISRNKGEPLHENLEINDEISYLYLGASSINEHHLMIHKYDFEEPSILLPPEDLSIKYKTYSSLDRFWTDGNYYDTIVKDDFSFIVRISDRDSQRGKPDRFEIDIYDNKDYAHIANVSFRKDYFTFETIAYIVDSIEVDDY